MPEKKEIPNKKEIDSHFFSEVSPKKNSLSHQDRNYNFPEKLLEVVEQMKVLVMDAKIKPFEEEFNKILAGMKSKKFIVTIVGEFSRGKSTLLNTFFGKDLLPVGNLPTTAMLTKITYNPKEMLVYMNKKGGKKTYPLQGDSWTGLTADSGNGDPKGVVFVGLANEWLKANGVEFVDTPGAGDLFDYRASLVEDALICSDGAIITLSALTLVSQTEKAFIELRLLSNKIPRLMVVITKLDQIADEDRLKIVEYIYQKLKVFEIEIPLFIAQDQLGLVTNNHVMGIGMKDIQKEIEDWTKDPNYLELKTRSIYARLYHVLDLYEKTISDQVSFMELNDQKKNEITLNYQEKIRKAGLAWSDIAVSTADRLEKTVNNIESLLLEKKELILDKLIFELGHSNNPKQWIEKDYPFKLKTEIINLATHIENVATNAYNNDLKWLNDKVIKQFNLTVFVESERFVNKDSIRNIVVEELTEMKDLGKARLYSKIATGVVTIASLVVFRSFSPLVFSTGGGIATEMFLGKSLENQKDQVKVILCEHFSSYIDNTFEPVVDKIRNLYGKASKETKAQEKLWNLSQAEIMNQVKNNYINKTVEENKVMISRIIKIKSRLLENEPM